MGSLNMKQISAVLSISIAIAMLTPTIVFSENVNDSEIAIQTDIVAVNFDSSDQYALEGIGADIVSLKSWGGYVKVTDQQRDIISNNFEVNEIPDRTTLNFLEQGITFDTKIGHNLDEVWTNPDTETYLVQFVAPSIGEWYEGIEKISGPISRYVNDNAVVVKLDEEQKAEIASLNFVEWIGPYEPGFKVDQSLLNKVGPVQLEVYNYYGVDEDTLNTELKHLGSWDNYKSDHGSVICTIDSSKLPDVARLESASLVTFLPEMGLHNNKGSRNARAWELWDNTVSGLSIDLTGLGQAIHIQDTGLDATHWDFVRGPEGNRIIYAQSTTDSDGHGTATAGNALGNGYCMESYLGLTLNDHVYNELASSNDAGRNDLAGYAGRAPEAGLVHYAGLVSSEWDDGYSRGARIFSNSWGPSTISPGYSGTADVFMDNGAYSGSLVLFSAGNDGPAQYTGSGNSNGKLTVGVGASENFRPNLFFDSADDPNTLADFSARGPVSSSDARIKPDICETGTGGRTPASDDSPDYSDILNGAYSEAEPIEEQQPGTCDYTQSFGGTSMSCPCAAGDAALVRQYLMDIQGESGFGGGPHANMIKNLMIHGATDMGYGYPSYAQGWGLVNVQDSVAPLAPNVLQYWDYSSLGSGQWTQTLDVLDSAYPLKVTMTHWDATGSGTLTTDYDLILTSPTGDIYQGNAFNEAWSVANPQWGVNTAYPTWVYPSQTYDFDTNNLGGDDINNVEMIRVKNPELGTWTITVDHNHGSAERFDVAATCAGDPSVDVNANAYKVSMVLDTTLVMPERDDLGWASFQSVPGGSVVVPYWIANGGTSNDNYNLGAPILPSGFSVSYVPTSPVSIDSANKIHGFARINVGGTVAAGTYVIKLSATSNNDGTSPIAQGTILFNIDVVDFELPPVQIPVDSQLHLSNPSLVHWGSSIGMTYVQFTEYGQHVYFVRSDDNGATWGTPVLVRGSYHAGYVGIARASGGTYDGRLMIAYTDYSPNGYGGNTADTRGNEIWIAYSSNNGDTWSNVEVYTGGEGEAGSLRNGYRCVCPVYSSFGSRWFVIVEDFEYSSTDLNSATQTGISVGCKESSNGGASWGSHIELDPDTTNRYYFFPFAYQDNDGGIALWYYERDSNDAAQDRDGKWQYYDGSWGTAVDCWDTGDNLMMPQGVATTQGGGNRNYGGYIKGSHTDLDREFTLIYTDNEGGSFTTNGGNGYEASANNIVTSDTHYGSRYICEMEFTAGDNQVWTMVMQLPKYDVYGNQNLYVTADDSYSTTTGRTEFFATADSYHKSNQRACIGSGNNVVVGYDTKSVDGTTNLNLVTFSTGFAGVADNTGPVVEYPTTDKVYMNSGELVYVAGNVNDIKTGGSDIQAARYYTDVDATLIPMIAVDGTYNNMQEGAITNAANRLDTSGYSTGWHTIYIQGQDSQGNWGAFYETYIYTDFINTPPTITVTDPNGGETLTAGGTYDIQWTMSDAEDADTALSVDLYYSTDGGGSFPNLIQAGITGQTSPATYNWNPVPTIDNNQVRIRAIVTDTGFLTDQDDSDGNCYIDNTWPVAATNPHAELDGTGVRIYWDASASSDIDHYTVYWGMNVWDPSGDSYGTSINAGLNTDVLHANVGINNPSSYVYQVRTYDLAGHETRTTIQAAKWGSTQAILAREPDWFLLGSPLVQSDTTIGHVIQGFLLPASMDYLRAYDADTGVWSSYNPVAPSSINTLTDINTDQGFWMHLANNARFATAGYVEDKAITLYDGWNLVAYPYAQRTMTTGAIMADLAANCPNYDGMLIEDLTTPAPYHITTPAGTESISHNMGFWVHVTGDTTWTVLNY